MACIWFAWKSSFMKDISRCHFIKKKKKTQQFAEAENVMWNIPKQNSYNSLNDHLTNITYINICIDK